LAEKRTDQKKRYAIEDGRAEWDDAERQVRASKRDSRQGLTVSVKSSNSNGSKRKAGEAVAEAMREIDATSKHKKKKHKEGKGKKN
jgi:hypothetical protein